MRQTIPLSRFHIALFALASVSAACGGGTGSRQAPDFKLSTLAGDPFALETTRGKVVVVDFWATWCEPCHETVPILTRLHRDHAKDGFTVLGVNVDEPGAPVKAFVDRYSIGYPVLMDTDRAVMGSFRARGLPNLYLLDRQGRIRKHWVGLDRGLEQAMEAEIRTLLEEKS